MRKIKFRAWKESEQRMIPWEELMTLGKSFVDVLQRVYLKDVMQYTGLKDKNGKEIYEGDILSSPHFVDAAGRQHQLFHLVQWSDKYRGWFLLSCNSMNEDDGSIMLWVSNGVSLTVAGNIHENPELAEGGDE